MESDYACEMCMRNRPIAGSAKEFTCKDCGRKWVLVLETGAYWEREGGEMQYLLYDEINGDTVKELSEIFKKEKFVHIRVNSPGGNIRDAMQLYKMICDREKEWGKTTFVSIDGIAAGAASFFFLGVGDSFMDRDAHIILTEPWIIAMFEDIEKGSKEVDEVKREMIDIYEKHTKLKKVEILELMKSQKPVGVDDALRYGLVRDES